MRKGWKEAMGSGLTSEKVLALIRDGMRQVDIARTYGVSRQYVSKLAKRGGYDSIIAQVSENMPWVVSPRFFDQTIYKYLRLHANFMLQGAHKMPPSSRQKLLSFHRKLHSNNWVVDYSETTGFLYSPKAPGTWDLIVAQRPGLRMSTTGTKIWAPLSAAQLEEITQPVTPEPNNEEE